MSMSTNFRDGFILFITQQLGFVYFYIEANALLLQGYNLAKFIWP